MQLVEIDFNWNSGEYVKGFISDADGPLTLGDDVILVDPENGTRRKAEVAKLGKSIAWFSVFPS